MPLPTYTTKTDGVDTVMAADVNNLQNEVAPIAAATLAVRYSTAHTSTATTLTNSSYPLQSVSSTAAGTFTLPAASTANHAFFVVNRGSYTMTVNNSSTALVAYVRPASMAIFAPDSTANWYGLQSVQLPRSGSTTSNATPAINTDLYDAYSITALAAAITSFTTNLSGSPVNFQKLIIRIKDNGTNRAITWGASFEAVGVSLPTTTTANKRLTVGFIYDSVSAKWGCVASVEEA